MATKERVTVQFLSDTKNYISGVEKATDAQESLTKAVKDTDKAQDQLNDGNELVSDSLTDLNQSLTSTTEGLIDSATGMSGLGAAATKIAGRISTAAKALSGFQKALIATGIGAIVAGLAAIVAYWEDIALWIGLSTEAAKEFNDQEAEQIEEVETMLSLRIKLYELQGRSEREINALRARTYEEEVINARIAYGAALQRVQAEQDLAEALGATHDANSLASQDLARQTLDLQILEQQVKNLRDTLQPINAAGEPGQGTGLQLYPLANLSEDEKNLDRLIKKVQDMEKANAKAADDFASGQEKITAAQVAGMNSVFGLAGALAEDNQKLQGSIQIGEAIANTAVAVTAATKVPATAPFVIPALLAIGAAQVATIAKNMKTSGEAGGDVGATIPEAAPVAPEQQIETAVSDTAPQVVPVLVTEDLNTVQARVLVTEQRGSI